MRTVAMRARLLAILAASVWGCGSVVAQAAAHRSEATARVFARIAPSITVSEPRPVIVDLRDHPLGSPILGQVRFLVQANTQEVELQVACTDLYKAGDPSCAYKIPVAGAGARISCEHGNEIGGADRLVPWQPNPPAGLLPAGWTGAVSEVRVFAASTAATFSQNVAVDVCWNTPDPGLPVGEYIGFVKLIGMVRP
jgi:hypothetical protein